MSRSAGLLWQQMHNGWVSWLSNSMVLVEETENTPVYKKKETLCLGIFPWRLVASNTGHMKLPWLCLPLWAAPPLAVYAPRSLLLHWWGSSSSITHSSILLWVTMDGRENNAQRTAAGRVFSVLMLPLDPSEWPIVCDSWSKDWKEWDKWQPTPYCHSRTEAGADKTPDSDAPDLPKLCSQQGKKNTRAEAANCLNVSLRSAATQSCSQWMVPSWESFPLSCRLARQCTASCQNICAINFHCITWKYFHLSWYYLKA